MSEENGTKRHSIEELKADLKVLKILDDQLTIHLSALNNMEGEMLPVDKASTYIAMEPVISSMLRYTIKYDIKFGPHAICTSESAALLCKKVVRVLTQAAELQRKDTP